MTSTFKWSSESSSGGFIGTLTSDSYSKNVINVYKGGYIFSSNCVMAFRMSCSKDVWSNKKSCFPWDRKV